MRVAIPLLENPKPANTGAARSLRHAHFILREPFEYHPRALIAAHFLMQPNAESNLTFIKVKSRFDYEEGVEVQFEKLKSEKFLELSEEDHHYDRNLHRFRRQEYLIGRTSKLKRLMLITACALGCSWLYSCVTGSNTNAFQSGLKVKKALGSMVGELDQQKKVWDFVDI